MARNSNYSRSSSGRSGSRQYNRRSSSGRKKNSGFSSLVVITLTIFIATVVLFAVAINMLMSNKDKNTDDVSSSSSQVSSSANTVIPFDDTSDEASSEDISSEDVSSESSHPSFEGTWKKTDVYESAKATLKISDQTEDGFTFTFKIWNGDTTSSISGTATFTKQKVAVYKKSSATLTFDYGSKYLSVYHSGTNKALGFSTSVTIDGKFTQGTPNYYTEKETNTYDYNVYKSSKVVKALKSTLSSDDYELYTELMEKGLKSPIPYERTVDKNGNKINVDTELKQVKYYANLSNIGMDMIFICSNSGKIYVLFYDVEEMRYYTNDQSYSSKMPKSFQDVADSKGMKPIFK